MKKELKSGILSADKLADHRPINRPTVGRPSAGLMLSRFNFTGQMPSFFFLFFLFSLLSLSRLFHSYRYEPIGSWGETGVPRENHLTHPQAELGLSHMASAGLEPTPVTAVK